MEDIEEDGPSKKGKENEPESNKPKPTGKKTPEKATDKKTPEKAADKKTPDKATDKKTTKKTPEKSAEVEEVEEKKTKKHGLLNWLKLRVRFSWVFGDARKLLPSNLTMLCACLNYIECIYYVHFKSTKSNSIFYLLFNVYSSAISRN